jgi:hypothetical protein
MVFVCYGTQPGQPMLWITTQVWGLVPKTKDEVRVLLNRRKLGLTLGRAFVDSDGKEATYRVSTHGGHHVHRAALAPQFD